MVLADTSVWIDHFRRGNDHLSDLLKKDNIVCHKYIIGELACGNLLKREEIIDQLKKLIVVETLHFNEVLYFVENNELYSKGLGWVDINLLASAIISNIELWTLDKRLKKVSLEFNIGYKET